jgi:hypothetical protein
MSYVVLVALAVLAALAVSASVLLLLKAHFYYSIKPANRPRRWVLLTLLVLFGVFLSWFPIWFLWPHSLPARVLTVMFTITWAVVLVALRWFSPLIDWAIKRRGKSLR